MTNLVLKVVDADLKGYGGFQWPAQGYVEAPDWSSGGGLYGWLNGEGTYVHHLNHPTDHKWLVIEADDTVKWQGVDKYNTKFKVRFKSGGVVYSGDKSGAVAYLISRGAINASSDVNVVCFTSDQCRELHRLAYARNPEPNQSNNYAAMASRFAADTIDFGHARNGVPGENSAVAAAFQAALTTSNAVQQREDFRLDKLRLLGVIV